MYTVNNFLTFRFYFRTIARDFIYFSSENAEVSQADSGDVGNDSGEQVGCNIGDASVNTEVFKKTRAVGACIEQLRYINLKNHSI